MPTKTESKCNGESAKPSFLAAANKDGGSALNIDTSRIGSEPSIAVDEALFMSFLDTVDASDEDKSACIQLVWSIVFEFSSLGFDLHPLQLLRTGCGQSKKLTDNDQTGATDVIK